MVGVWRATGGQAREEGFGVGAVDRSQLPEFEAGVDSVGEVLPGRDGREGPVTAEKHMPGSGEGKQGGQGGRARGQSGVEVEGAEVVQDVQRAACGVGGEGQGQAVRGVGQKASGVAEDEPDSGVSPEDAGSDEEVGRSGGVEQEVGGERWDAVDGWSGQVSRVDEDDGGALVQGLPQRILVGATKVVAVAVGEQSDAVGAEFVEDATGLGGGGRDVGIGRVAKYPNRVGCSAASPAA